ncbi:MAG: DNA primase [Phycisphaerales bacterium JB063]
MSFHGNDDKERVQGATDIVRLIGEQVQLRPKGRELAGLCPFHDDKTPSMFVSPAKQIYKCFSCGAGGDCFTFVMEYHKMDFVEALKYLADRGGIELTPWKPSGQQGDAGSAMGGSAAQQGESPRKRLLAANDQALAFYRTMLADPALGQAARDYIEQRGIAPEMVEQFQLGYAPDRWDALAQHVAKQGADAPAFGKAGLIALRGADHDTIVNDASTAYDKLRHRLIFPICDDLGRAIAFGGRVMPGGTLDDPTTDAKYLNSPESSLFNKSQTLYGLHLAKKAIIDSKRAVIVEGYTDVIACHQHGLNNVVAALGTAFTHQHAAKLRRFCETVVLVFDGDAAGFKAADRAVEVLMTGEIDVAIAILPEGQDPDTLLAQDGGMDRWHALIDNAQDAMTYLLARLEDDLNKAGTITGRQSVSTEFLARLARHGLVSMSPIRRALILGQVAAMLHMPESAVLDEVKRLAPRVYEGPSQDEYADVDEENSVPFEVADEASRATLRSAQLAERQLIGCLLRNNDLFEYTLPDGTDFCEAVLAGELSPPHRLVYQMLHDRLAEGKAVSLAGLLGDLAEARLDGERSVVIQADAELDALLRDREDSLQALFEAAACSVAHRRVQREYDASRQQLAARQTGGPADQVALAQQLLEQRRAHGSPGRIARTRS